jgi:hypothetical protein
MKTSHYTTPRSLEACQFAHDADPIEYAPRGIDYQDKIVIVACFIAICVAAFMLASGVIK